jgi:cyclophilin family peptidyl-prolyl cis-trans isomerase
MRRAIAITVIGAFVLSACGPTVVRPPSPSPTVAPAATRAPTPTAGGAATSAATPASSPATTAIVELEKGGSFTIALRPDKAPQTVARFAGKAREGFYNGLKFHRVEDWVVQGGDPLGTGTGGGRVPSEYNDLPFVLGAVGIARGQDKAFNNESQWFVVKREASWLNNEYTNFGTVTSGMDVVQKIAIGDKIKTIRVQ